MFSMYIRTGIRNLLRNRSFSLINLTGLALGLASIMVLSVMLYQYMTANGQFRNKQSMYYIKGRYATGNESVQTTFPLLYEALKTSPDIVTGTHIQSWRNPWLKNADKEFQEKTWYVDSGFFRVLSYPLESGNPATALREKNSIVLSHEMTEKLFGKGKEAIGKTLYMDDSIPMTVTGVLEPVPSNTVLRPQVLLTTALLKEDKDFASGADWYNTFADNYLLLRPDADTAKVNAQLNQVVAAHYAPENRNVRLRVVPYSKYVHEEAGNMIQVIVKGIVGMIVFILLVVIANLVNLNAAMLFSRHREVAVKKILGGSRFHVIMQFCIENAILVVVSIGIALVIFSSLLMPAINAMIGDRFGNIVLNIRHDYPLALALIGLGLLIVVCIGSYPAWHLNSLKVTDAIKGRLGPGNNKQYTRNFFITVQFVLAITFIGITIILNSQIRHMKGAALGFEKENVLVVPMDLAYKNFASASARFDVLLNDLRNNPYVKGISTSEDIPTSYNDNYNNYSDVSTGRNLNFRQANTDAGILSTYRIPIIEGRDFVNASDPGRLKEIIINKRAVELLGWKGSAIGRQLKSGGGNETFTVVGVMDNFYYQDLSRNIEPLMHHYAAKQQLGYTYLSVRVDPRHSNEVLAQIQEGFKAMPARRAWRYEYLSDRIDKQYTLLDGILKATNYVALLTIFIAAMGLFGLIALFTRQRVKEIGIRKVLGASAASIVGLLSRNFLLLVGIAMLVAAPLAWVVMDSWLSDFAYRISIQWWMLSGAGLIACGIALVTVGFHAIRAAAANPVDSLRSE